MTRAGKILVPAQTTPLGPDGKLWNRGGGWTYTDVLVLIGTWTNGNRLSWRASQRVVGDPKRTTRGVIEPTLAEFKDGSILMVMRGSNGGKADPRHELPSYKWFAVSQDGGESWSTPAPWTFEDGQVFFRLRFYRSSGVPDRLYAEGRTQSSYRDQDLTLARCFRRAP